MTLFIGTVYCLRFTTHVLKGIAGFLNKQKLKGLCSSHQLSEPQQIPEPRGMKKKKEREERGGRIGFIWRRGSGKKNTYIRFSLLGWPTIKCLPDVDGFSIEIEQ